MLLAFDRAPASDRSFDEAGRLHVANCPISKAMVCPYYGYEIPGWEELGLVKDRKYMLLRPAEELERAAPSFDNVQVLDDHTPVHAENNGSEPWCGTVSGVFFDGTYLRAGILSVWTKDAIDAVESEEKCELSASYSYDPIMEPGTFEGLRYDGRMVNISGNHVALVEEGRAGPDVHVSDSLPKGFRMKKIALLAAVSGTALTKAVRGLANDADIDGDELLKLIAVAASAGEGEAADDEDMNDDPNISGATLKKADDEDMDGADDEDEDDDDDKDKKAEDEEEGEGEEGKKEGANDRKPRRVVAPAMDAKAIEDRVIRRMTAWNTAVSKVAPHLGVVKIAMDAAPDGARGLYRKALDSAGVDHKGITSTVALERLVDLLPKPAAAFAMDSRRGAEPSPLDSVLGDRRAIHRS